MSSKIIRFKNTLAEKAQKTYLTDAYSSGGTTLPVTNSNGFNASWAVQIGETGNEKSEVKLLHTSIPASGTALDLTATTGYDHPADTPVYAINYDQVIFKRSTTGTAGTATAITGGTVTVTADSPYTTFEDSTADDGYAYRVSLLNSVTSGTSTNSDWIVPSGYTFYSLAKLRSRAKRKLFSSEYIENDDLIDDWINEWLETMTNTAVDVNQDYLLGTTDIAHGTNGLATVTATDFKELRRVWYTTNGSDFYKASKIDYNDFWPGEEFGTSSPRYYHLGDSVVGKLPDGLAGTARITYYKRPSILSSNSDEIPLSMRSYTRSFVDYAVSQAYYMDSKADIGDRLLGQANVMLAQFRDEITPRGKTGPETINLVETIDSDDLFEFF